MKYIIGIDPGKNGGIAVLGVEGEVIDCFKMPETPKEIYLKLEQITLKNKSYIYLEKVGGRPRQSDSGMFNFGMGYGYLEMAAIALNIPIETVTPQKWQKEFQLGSKNDKTVTEWKKKLKHKAESIFPKIKITLFTSDALLIAEYGRRKNK